MQRHSIKIDEPFCFESGGVLPGLELVYHTSPRAYTPGEKVVWICHALTGNSNPEEWWPEMVGKGCVFDPDKYYVVCAGILGSPYGSTGPASINPATGKPFLLDFPLLTVRDMVRANILVRKHLGIEKVDLMLGPSVGGFQTLEWAIMEPEVVSRAVFLATSTKATPYFVAFNEAQRMALEADPTFREAASLEGGKAGLACARAIAMISYRTDSGYNATQQEQDPDFLFADRAGSYQRYQGKKLVDRFDAYSYWYLTKSLDSQNVGRGRGGVDKALKNIKARCLMIAIDTDVLFPPRDSKATVAELPNAEYREISSIYGHDGFLIEADQLTAILQPLLNQI
ncbi:MAG: homoserine O-acetyltransferase [Bacteroidales bacterium]|nr:homoserine O-acetyltransferase [Bacteroidales bacterium]